MRISDWSSDVCSSDLLPLRPRRRRRRTDQAVLLAPGAGRQAAGADVATGDQVARRPDPGQLPEPAQDRRRRQRRQGRQAGADGAAGARRPVGARRLRLKRVRPVAGQPRLSRAVGQLADWKRVVQGTGVSVSVYPVSGSIIKKKKVITKTLT